MPSLIVQITAPITAVEAALGLFLNSVNLYVVCVGEYLCNRIQPVQPDHQRETIRYHHDHQERHPVLPVSRHLDAVEITYRTRDREVLCTEEIRILDNWVCKMRLIFALYQPLHQRLGCVEKYTHPLLSPSNRSTTPL